MRQPSCSFGSPIETAAAAQELTLEKMAVLIREVTVARGYDPRDCVLFCFGGAGALFGLDLASELEMRTVYVPPAATVFSAVGATLSRVAYEAKTGIYARIETLDPAALAAAARDVADRALALLAGDALPVAELRLEVDLKYRVQPETLTVPLGARVGVFDLADLQDLDDDIFAASVGRFHALHRQLYGLDRGGEAVDLVTLRAIAAGPGSDGWALRGTTGERVEPTPRRTRTWVRRGISLADVPAISIGRLHAGPVTGPCFLEDAYTTIPVPPGATARIDDLGGIVLRWIKDGPR